MRVVAQRVSQASVTVDGEVKDAIGPGLCLLVAIGSDDEQADIPAVVDKICGLRVFPDAEGKMNRSLLDVGGEVLVVSQFTLLGDARKGRRPSFTAAAGPELARPLLDRLRDEFRSRGVSTSTGEFGVMMNVALVNDGPVTLVLDFTKGRLV